MYSVTLCLLVSAADEFCKQFEPRLGLIKRHALSESKSFDTLLIFLKEIFEKINILKKSSIRQISMHNYPVDK